MRSWRGYVHYDTTPCSIQEKWFTWLTVFLFNKAVMMEELWQVTPPVMTRSRKPRLSYRNLCCFPHSLDWCHSVYNQSHITTSEKLWQVLLPFMMTSQTPCLRLVWTGYGIKVMGCFIFAETLYSFTKWLVKYPLWGLITSWKTSLIKINSFNNLYNPQR